VRDEIAMGCSRIEEWVVPLELSFLIGRLWGSITRHDVAEVLVGVQLILGSDGRVRLSGERKKRVCREKGGGGQFIRRERHGH
jgi:hypothetical protein